MYNRENATIQAFCAFGCKKTPIISVSAFIPLLRLRFGALKVRSSVHNNRLRCTLCAFARKLIHP